VSHFSTNFVKSIEKFLHNPTSKQSENMTGLADTGKYTIQWAVTQSTSRPTTV